MAMSKFHEFVQKKQAGAADGEDMQQPAGQGLFASTGMDQQAMVRFMRSMKQMLSTRGVVGDGDDKKAARKVLTILRQPIMRLAEMGLTADDIMLVIQQVVNLVIGMRSYTGFNPNMVRSRISNQISQQ